MRQIYDCLKDDHDKVKRLLAELISTETDGPIRSGLIAELRDELIPHARAEEAVFYNSLRSIDETNSTGINDMVGDAYKEHLIAETVLRTIQMKDKMDLDTRTSAKKLQDNLLHHIAEEEGRLFPRARLLLSDEEALSLGDAFVRLKMEVRPEGFLSTTIDLVRNMLPIRLKKYLGEETTPKAS